MTKEKSIIRTARESDAEALVEIYTPYVLHTAVTYEWEVPTVEEFAGRIRKVLSRFPYLVAELDGEPVGYAYAAAYGERKAFDWTVETSIYIKEDKKGLGLGRMLYDALEDILLRQNVLNLIARVACPEPEDEYLTMDSIRFHEHRGYTLLGMAHRCGYKFDRWYHLAWLEKHLGTHGPGHPPVIPFGEIRGELGW